MVLVTTLELSTTFLQSIMKPISEPSLNRENNDIHEKNVEKDSVPMPEAIPPKMRVSEGKSHPIGHVSESEMTSSLSRMQRKVDQIELANHVSLQIFSNDLTKNNKNAIIFLHGGPGLSYNDTFETLTSWSLDNGYTLVAPEIAGSDKPGLANTSDSFGKPPNYVRDLKSVIQHLRQLPDFKDKNFCVVAHSWGGFQLASLLTDPSISDEEKNFFKQVVFISPNLDSAQTRLFAMNEQDGGFTNEYDLQAEMARRHAGINSNSAGRISFSYNPLMNKNLNEEVSPFYHLEKMPKHIHCLFVHPVRDTTVPVSQSLAAAKKINDNAGNAKLVMTTTGGHMFFKAGEVNDPYATTSCFCAIDTLIKDPDSVCKLTLDGESLDDSDSENIDKKIKEKHSQYKNQRYLLEEWHGNGDTANTSDRQNKTQVLMQMKEQKESMLKIMKDRGLMNSSGYKNTFESLSVINGLLNTQ